MSWLISYDEICIAHCGLAKPSFDHNRIRRQKDQQADDPETNSEQVLLRALSHQADDADQNDDRKQNHKNIEPVKCRRFCRFLRCLEQHRETSS